MSLYPGSFLRPEGTKVEGEDVWDMMIRVASHPFAKEEWKKYVPLFVDGINTTISRLDQLLMAHGSVIAVPLKLAILQTNSQLRVEQQAYLLTPQLAQLAGNNDNLLVSRFQETLRTLSRLAHSADRERAPVEKTHNKPLKKRRARKNARAS